MWVPPKLLSVCQLALLLAGGACAATSKQDSTQWPDESAQTGSSVAPPMEVVSMPITSLERSEVIEVIDAGLGAFLADFVTEPSLDERGAFQGFLIVEITDPARFRGLGLGPGDVVTRINDQPIERPAEAYAAFIALRTAPSLEISYLRGGRPMRLSLPIVASKEPAAAAKPAALPQPVSPENPATPQADEQASVPASP